MTLLQDWQLKIGVSPDNDFGPKTYAASLAWRGGAYTAPQDAPAQTINQAGMDLIKEFEGFRAEAYRDSVGVLTIGYGTTAAAGVGITPALGMVITQAQAEAYLQAAVDMFADEIKAKMTREPTPNQFAAMVSLAYNIGPGAFGHSSVLRHFNAGNMEAAAASFALWNKAGGRELAGLTRRRAAEAAMFRKQ
jgi:lysozyme